MKQSRMIPFITHTWNPIAGGYQDKEGVQAACPFLCKYCWARRLINLFKNDNLSKKYSGPIRLDHTIDRRHKSGSFVFVCDMTDIGHPRIPKSVIVDILESIKFHNETNFLLLTKNPNFYTNWKHLIPLNAYLGLTLETDSDKITESISLAPIASARMHEMDRVKNLMPDHRIFISIEPIIRFGPRLSYWLRELEPWAVAVGYDNYKYELPEPTKDRTLKLIEELEGFTTVHLKTIRERWNE